MTAPRLPAAAPIPLAEPGAGLPFLEGLISRYWLLPRSAKRMTWQDVDAMIEREGAKVLRVYEALKTEDRTTQVLVPRQRGLEDSSRYWSPAMVLEHLVEVGTQMQRVIIDLSHGRIPPGKADIAAVKPKGANSHVTDASFRELYAQQTSYLAREVGNQDSPSRFVHPWFGAITARQWHWLMGTHTYIHRKQIEAVRAKLRS